MSPVKIKKGRITDSDLESLASLLYDNVYDTGPGAWDTPEKAVQAHEDDISEVAIERHGRRLTDKQWAAVAKNALPSVDHLFGRWLEKGLLP